MPHRVIFLTSALVVAGLFSLSASADETTPPPLRKIAGEWAEIVTDLPPAAGTDRLAESFDAAVPQWLRFWGVAASRIADWRVTVYVMRDVDAFRRRRLLPDSLPPFEHGYAMGNTAWVVAQDSDYYTRHLVLHEGIHSLAFHLFGGAGPFWFMEGTAELLATHEGLAKNLRLPVIPRNREAAPLWGRLKVIRQRREAGGFPSIESVMRYPNRLTNSVERYAWSWTAATLMNMYPEYRKELIESAPRGDDQSAQFTRTLYRNLFDQWPVLRARWRLLVDGLDYGYDLSRNRVDLNVGAPLWPAGGTGPNETLDINIAADQGWQSVGRRIRAGTTLRLTAAGRYSLGEDPAPWICEPQGVTIRYHRGHPLGMVVAVLLPTEPAASNTIQPLELIPVGRAATIEVDEESWLLLQIGDAPAELADNSGHASVQIEPE